MEESDFVSRIQIINKYNNLSLPIKSTLWFMVCNFSQKGLSMITTPIFTRLMTEEEYGVCGVFSSWGMIFEIFVSLCLGSCSMVLYARTENKEKILSALTSLQLLLGTIWIVIFILTGNQIAKLLDMPKALCIAMILNAVATESIYLWMGYKRYLYEYRGSVGMTFVITFISTIVSVISVCFFSNSAEGRLLPFVFVNVCASLFIYYLDLQKSLTFFDSNIWRFAFSFGIPLIPHGISSFILSVSDRLMINNMCGIKDVAMYSVAGSVGAIISVFTASINVSFAPYQFQQIKSKNYNILSKRADQVILFVAMILFGIMLLGNEIIMIFGGYKYEESAQIIAPLCLGAFFSYMFQLFSRVQEYYLHKGTISIASSLCAILNVVLNYVYIGRYGYRAAAYTTFISYLLFCFFHYLFYKRTLRKDLDNNPIYNIKHLAIISFGLIISGVTIGWINNIPVIKYMVVIVLACIFIIKRKSIIGLIRGL